MPKTKEVNEWLKRAEDDLAAARAITKENAPYWVACFHCQQTAEKALKAAQIYFLKDFQKEHDLEVLINSLQKHFKADSVRRPAINLTDYYVATRYPGIKESELTRKDALLALKDAEEILEYIKSKLK